MKKNQMMTRLIAVLAFLLALSQAAVAESYTANTMRLLYCEGAVDIVDAGGAPRFVMENVRFNDGEALITGEDGVAVVSLDSDRFATLDANSRVTFEQQASSMKLTLEEGSLLLDVQRKLDANESLDIQTSTMTVGIRGTIVYLTERHSETGDGVRNTLGVLEGTAEVTYLNPNGVRQTVPVGAGEVATLAAVSAAEPVIDVRVEPLAPQDVPDFVTQLPDALPDTSRRIEESIARLGEEGDSPDYPADGSWTWDAPVTLVAQSASKLFDSQPLSRPSDVLVYGLPAQFTIDVTAHGEITYPGIDTNFVGNFAIYNAAGKDVTSHFTNIQKVNGRLVVDPAPLTIWTGSAKKVYDGTPLTNPKAGVTARPGYEENTTPWRNLSYVQTTASDAQVLLGLCGVTWVHATNPLTAETREIALQAGERLTVVLNDTGDGQSIEFRTDKLSVQDIPVEALSLYARNRALFVQACADAGWEEQALTERIFVQTQSPEFAGWGDDTVSRYGLELSDAEADRLMPDSTNVRITIDTDITNYNGRPLGSNEAHFTPVNVPEDIVVTATGSQTEVGQSPNTYVIDWGSSDPGWYILDEDLGTLTVTKAAEREREEDEPETYDDNVVLTAASAEKVYDGNPLTGPAVSASGLPDGFSFEATASGSQTDAGTGENQVTAYRILDAKGKDVTAQFTNISTTKGALTVTPAPLTVTTGSASKAYDGAALTCAEASIAGLVNDETAAVAATGAQTEIGAGKNAYSIDWGATNPNNYAVTENLGTLEVTANDAPITITAATASKAYDGAALTANSITVAGLPEGLVASATVSGSQTVVGSAENTVSGYAILNADGGDVTANFTNISTAPGTLTVEPATITITTGSASKAYDGEALTCAEASITGLAEGETATVTATGAITDAGEAVNTYAIEWDADRTNYAVEEQLGTLEVTKRKVTFDLGGYTAEYYGGAMVPDGPNSEDAELEDFELIFGADEVAHGTIATFALPGGEVRLTCLGFEDAGTYTITPEVEFLSGKAENYELVYTNSTMTITPMEITVQLHDGSSLVYDGGFQDGHFTARNNDGYNVGYHIEDERVIFVGDGDILVSVTGGGTDAGDYTLSCTFAYHSDAQKKNCRITVTGTEMTIAPAPVTIMTGSNEKTYDGAPMTAGDAQISGLVAGENAEVVATGTITNAGSVPNSYSIDWGDTNVDNYAVTEELGTLTVNKAEVTVTTGSAKQPYHDGVVLTCDEAYITGLVNGETATVTATGILEKDGKTPNTYSIDWGDTNADNYTIIEDLGELELTIDTVTGTSLGLGAPPLGRAFGADPEAGSAPEGGQDDGDAPEDSDVPDAEEDAGDSGESDDVDGGEGEETPGNPEDPDAVDGARDASADSETADESNSMDSGESGAGASESSDAAAPESGSDAPGNADAASEGNTADSPGSSDAPGNADAASEGNAADSPGSSDVPGGDAPSGGEAG